MAVSVRLSDDLVTSAQVHAAAELRTIPKQIEHWARIGRIMIDNPELSYEFVSEMLLADAEVKQGTVKPYVRRTQSKN